MTARKGLRRYPFLSLFWRKKDIAESPTRSCEEERRSNITGYAQKITQTQTQTHNLIYL